MISERKIRGSPAVKLIPFTSAAAILEIIDFAVDKAIVLVWGISPAATQCSHLTLHFVE
jgi:hypothetical protein